MIMKELMGNLKTYDIKLQTQKNTLLRRNVNLVLSVARNQDFDEKYMTLLNRRFERIISRYGFINKEEPQGLDLTQSFQKITTDALT